jgi:hypothetical protein
MFLKLNKDGYDYWGPVIEPLVELSNLKGLRVRVMVLNVTFNNISIILWRSVLLVEETGVPGKNH